MDGDVGNGRSSKNIKNNPVVSIKNLDSVKVDVE